MQIGLALAGMIFSCVFANRGLQLKSFSEDEVRGCYVYNQTLAVCFNVQKDAIVILKTTGERLVQYHNLGPDMFYYQVMDQSFIARGPSMFFVPDEVSREPESLRAFAKDQYENEETVRDHFQAAVSELHYVPEVRLLELVSAALADNTTRLEILQPFHTLCLNLLQQAEIKIPPELSAEHGMEDDNADTQDREKRCSRPQRNRCRGLCGLGCNCWKWICGDCCWHLGCYQHDLCCNYSRFSTYCLFPYSYNFSCSKGFGGYKKCRRMGWR